MERKVYGIFDVGISLARQWMLVVLIPCLIGVIVASKLLHKTVMFTAVARVLPPQQNKETKDALLNQIGGTSALANSALTLKNPTDLYIGIMSSRTVLTSVAKATNLYEYYGQGIFQTIKTLDSRTKIRAARDGIIKIEVSDSSPEMAARLANAYISGFYEVAESISERDSQRREVYFGSLVEKARARLDRADSALKKTEERTGLIRLSGQEQAIVQSISELSGLISVKQAALRAMLVYGTDRNPDVRRTRRALSTLIAQREKLKSKRASAQRGKTIAASDAGQSSILVSLDDVPTALEETIKKRREVKYSEIMYELIGRSYELSKIDIARDIILLQVLDYAIPPTEKSSPKIVLSTAGSMFATFIWTVLIIITVDAVRLDARRRSAFKRLCLAFVRK